MSGPAGGPAARLMGWLVRCCAMNPKLCGAKYDSIPQLINVSSGDGAGITCFQRNGLFVVLGFAMLYATHSLQVLCSRCIKFRVSFAHTILFRQMSVYRSRQWRHCQCLRIALLPSTRAEKSLCPSRQPLRWEHSSKTLRKRVLLHEIWYSLSCMPIEKFI
jgi:hypothetical protein